MPKKTDDIEKRLGELENRQNMFFGGFTLPTSYVDPNTGKTMPMPSLNPFTLNTQQSTDSANTITGGAGNDIITGANTITGGAGNDALTGANTITGGAGNDALTGAAGDTGVVKGVGLAGSDNPLLESMGYVYDERTQSWGLPAGETKTKPSAEGANIALQGLRDETGGVEGVTADNIFQKLTDLGYTPDDIHKYITTSAFASNPEGGLYNATQDLLGQFSYDSETGQHTYTAAGPNVEPILKETGIDNLQNGNTRVRIVDRNPNSPTFGQYYFETRGPDGTVLFKSKTGTEADAKADIMELEQGKNVNPMYQEVNRVPNGDGTFTVTYIDTNPDSPTYNETFTNVEGNKEDDAGGGGGAGAGAGGGAGVGGPTNYGDVQAQFDQMAGLTGVNPSVTPNAVLTPQMTTALPQELEPNEQQLQNAQLATTNIISDEQIQALQAAGYTIKNNADTVAATTESLANVTNQALNAQTLSNLTKDVDEITGRPVVGESIIAQAPSKESIDQIKAEGLEAKDINQVDRRKTPTVGDFTGNFNDKINAASRSITPDEIVQPLDPRIANQAEKEVQYEKTVEATMQAAQASEDEMTRTIAQAVTQDMANVPKEATVQGQLENLMAQFADGNIPAYAAGAIRNANAQMAARGLSASSMAGGAIIQAAMESSLPIAAQDAQVFREINLSNINNKQKVALANQAAALNLSLADLNNRQQTALQNSTNGYKLQAQSLSNLQQVALANAQLKASIQEKELGFDQQRAIVNAARYAEIEGINLNNQQQGIMQDSVNNMQVTLSNMSFKQQRELSKAQIDAALTGQELTNDQQSAVLNAARIAEVNNLTFNEEQQRNLNNSQLMQNMTLANLDSEMKTALNNAATYANMDITNLNNRQRAQVENAQNFLNMDLANLSNEQQGEILKYQAKVDAIFGDTAADNARLQFNATSENQVDEFFAQLGAQVAQQNANRVAAMKEFNVDQKNATSKFNASLVDTREKFNSTMTAQINQSNATWRRQINTANTAAQNEANRVNALNTFGMNQNALNNLWQAYRDEASWLFKQGLTREQFEHEITKINLQTDAQFRLYDRSVSDNAWGAAGSLAYDIWRQKQLDKQGD